MGDADHLSLDGPDGDAEDRFCQIAGFFIDVAVEAGIGIGVVDDDPLSRGEDPAGHAGIVEDADLPVEIPLGDAGVKLARFAVVEKEGTPVGLNLPRGDLDERLEDLVEGLERGDCPGDIQQKRELVRFPAPLLPCGLFFRTAVFFHCALPAWTAS